METLVEIQPGRKVFQRLFLGIMLWFVGRAAQAAGRVDPEVKKEFDAMPEHFTFSLGAFPSGPYMVVGKGPDGRARYFGADILRHPPDLEMTLKSMTHLFLLLTFRESTPVSSARDRLAVSGDIPQACAAVRILNIVQVYLLPRFLAKMAIKRYPRWSFKRHTLDRCRVLFRTLAGF